MWKRKIIFGGGKYIFSEENKTRKEKWGIYLETENRFFLQGRGLTVEEKDVYLDMENMFLWRRRITEKEKEDQLQEAGPSRWSFARGWLILMIICNRPTDPEIICKRLVDSSDNLQEVGRSGWSFARGRSRGWSFARSQSIWMIICNRYVHPDDHL